MNRMVTDTAHHYWNAEWQRADHSSPWAMPEPWVMDHAVFSKNSGPKLRLMRSRSSESNIAPARAPLPAPNISNSICSLAAIGDCIRWMPK